jgi:hypothetical protein
LGNSSNPLTPTALNAASVHAAPERQAAQGVYLKGYGVVYTATLAMPLSPAVSEGSKPAPKPLTEWERTRMELRGEKVEPVKTAASHESLADTVLKMLADNGKHLTQLPENEQITVVLTLPRAQSCTACHTDPFKEPRSTGSNKGGSTSTGGSSGNTTTGSSTGGGDPFEEPRKKVTSLKKDAQKATLLGDLHLKQGKNEQAVASFEEALKGYLDASETLRRAGLDVKGKPETDAELERELVVTAAKLIQLYTAQGKQEEVQKMLKTLDGHVKRTKTETSDKSSETPAKVELPAKLVISAPKKLLEVVGSGKITFEEFRKNATVDYQPARTIEKRPAKALGS